MEIIEKEEEMEKKKEKEGRYKEIGQVMICDKCNHRNALGLGKCEKCGYDLLPHRKWNEKMGW